MVAFATGFVIMTFTLGSSFCCLALWTIQKSTALRESFGILCKIQMLTDLTLLSVTSAYCLIPAEYAPRDGSFTSYAVFYIAEISYHYSGAMHDLFAINRFVYIVFPAMQQSWREATPKILVICAIITAFHTILMTLMDVNLYWTYDRETFIWHMTDTEWTEFYGKYFEVYWSTVEIILIVALDSVIFGFIFFRKSKIHGKKAINRRARLILQSFCQCIPTTTVNIIYFFIFPSISSPNLQTALSSIWIVTNILDAFVIILFHFPQALAYTRKNRNVSVATLATGSTELR